MKKQMKDLKDPKYWRFSNSREIDAICGYFPMLDRENITVVIASVKDGEYDEVWVTESYRPFDPNATYHSLQNIKGD